MISLIARDPNAQVSIPFREICPFFSFDFRGADSVSSFNVRSGMALAFVSGFSGFSIFKDVPGSAGFSFLYFKQVRATCRLGIPQDHATTQLGSGFSGDCLSVLMANE